MCKIFSSSKKLLSSLAEIPYNGYNKTTAFLLKIQGLLFSATKIFVEDLQRSHIPPSFSPTVLDKMRICDTLYVLSLEGNIVSFFTGFFTVILCGFTPSTCNTPAVMKFTGFFKLKYLHCLSLKTFANLKWSWSHIISYSMKMLWLLTWWTEEILFGEIYHVFFPLLKNSHLWVMVVSSNLI